MRLWWNTAAFVFTHCLGTSPGRYGHAMVEQGRGCGSIRQPPGCATLAAECDSAPGSSNSTQISLSAAREAPHHPGPERGSRRRRMVRASACPCSMRAGRNGREGAPMSYESCKPPFSTPYLLRTGLTFSLESRPVSFSAEKEMDLAPAGQAPPGGPPPPGGQPAPGGPPAPQAGPCHRLGNFSPHHVENMDCIYSRSMI